MKSVFFKTQGVYSDYIDSFIDDLNDNGNAEVSFCASIQGLYYAFIEMDN